METDVDFFTSYKAVSNKLKKRFLKKPNLAEARDEFNHLAKSLNQSGCSHYAGFCSLAMAKCEQNMANSAGEVQALAEAGRYFLQADNLVESTCCANFEEHLNSAKHCFDLAIKNYISNNIPVMAGSLCEEIGAYLEKHERFDSASIYFHQAAELYYQNPLLYVQAQKKVMELKILLGEHYNALLTGIDMLQLIAQKGACKDDGFSLIGRFAELHCDCEVTVVLLLMLIDPHPLKIKPEFSEVLQKYTWAEATSEQAGNSFNRMSEDLFLLLQSVVMACSSKDISSLQYLQKELRSCLTNQQNSLLNLIIEEYQHSSGLGF